MTTAQATRLRLRWVALGSLVLFVVLSLLVRFNAATTSFDRAVGGPVADYTEDRRWLGDVALVLAEATRPVWLVLVLLVVVVLLASRGFTRTALWCLAVGAGGWLSVVVLKTVVDRDRPSYALESLTDRAFPSGHANGAALAAGIAVTLVSIFVRRRIQRHLVTTLALAFMVIVGLDRLVLGVHSLTDVLGGYLWALVWVAGAAWLVDPSPASEAQGQLPSVLPTTRRLAVILNPVKVEDVAEFRTLVNARAAELDWDEPSWFETTAEDPGRAMAHEAAVEGAELIVVCGGDGTVRTVCAEVAGTGIPVGVIPAGTGNLLARNLELPLYLRAAVDVALAGQDRAVDLVRVTGDGIGEDEHFLVMAGMGFDAAIMEGVNESIKAKVGWLAYVVSAVKNLMFQAVGFDISVDDQPFTRHRARTIVVGNVGFLQAGLPLLPDASLDDGRIDVVVINPRRFLSWLRIVVRVLGRGRKSDDTLTRMSGRRITVRAHTSVSRQIDGDSIGAGHELICECLPGRLLVRVPR